VNSDGYVALIILLAFIMFGCAYVKEDVFKFMLKPDNIVEEIFEEVIEAKTGLDIDLTPGSPED